MTRDENSTATRNAAARPPRYTRTSTEWPCIFNELFVREQIDPRVKALWEAERDDKPKWGDLRNTWRREHCRAINPWGSETCPFRPEECGLAFYQAISNSVRARNPHGYLIKVARSSGAARADEAQSRRARIRTDGADEGRVGRAPSDGVREGSAAGLAAEHGLPQRDVLPALPDGTREGVRGPVSRPVPIGDLLRSLDIRSRPRRGTDSSTDEGGGR